MIHFFVCEWQVLQRAQSETRSLLFKNLIKAQTFHLKEPIRNFFTGSEIVDKRDEDVVSVLVETNGGGM
jgi:hypothetical protein